MHGPGDAQGLTPVANTMEEEAETLLSDASDDVDRPRQTGHPARERPHGPFGHRCAEHVDRFGDADDLRDHERTVGAVAIGGGEREANPVDEGRALQDAGPVVDPRPLGDPGRTAARQLVRVHDIAVGLAARTESCRGGDVHRHRVAARDVHRHLAAPRAVAKHLRTDHLVVEGDRLRGKEIGDREVGRLGHPEALPGGGVEVQDPTPGVGDPDEVRRLLRELPPQG